MFRVYSIGSGCKLSPLRRQAWSRRVRQDRRRAMWVHSMPTHKELKSPDMRTKDSLAIHVVEQLSFLGRISSRSIFGATGIFVEERLLGIVINDTLFLHTGPTN